MRARAFDCGEINAFVGSYALRAKHLKRRCEPAPSLLRLLGGRKLNSTAAVAVRQHHGSLPWELKSAASSKLESWALKELKRSLCAGLSRPPQAAWRWACRASRNARPPSGPLGKPPSRVPSSTASTSINRLVRSRSRRSDHARLYLVALFSHARLVSLPSSIVGGGWASKILNVPCYPTSAVTRTALTASSTTPMDTWQRQLSRPAKRRT